jgi:hypothetical protein
LVFGSIERKKHKMSYYLPVNANSITQPKGSIVRAGSSPNTTLLAQADDPSHAQLIVGAVQVDVAPGSSGGISAGAILSPVLVSSEPNINDVIYLSAAQAGAGVTVPPALKVPIGFVIDKFQSGGSWYTSLCTIIPRVPITVTIP